MYQQTTITRTNKKHYHKGNQGFKCPLCGRRGKLKVIYDCWSYVEMECGWCGGTFERKKTH